MPVPDRSTNPKPFIPPAATARSALTTALTAWKGGRPSGRIEARPTAIQFVDLTLKPNQRLTGFEILGEVPDDHYRRFKVRLFLSNPDERPLVRYLVLWHESSRGLSRGRIVEMITHWEHHVAPADEVESVPAEKTDPRAVIARAASGEIEKPAADRRRAAESSRPIDEWSVLGYRRLELHAGFSHAAVPVSTTERSATLASVQAGGAWRRLVAAHGCRYSLRVPAGVARGVLGRLGRWETMRNGCWTRMTHLADRGDAESAPISENMEFFCPMDPGVVSNWPGRCGVCNMALVRRKKGEAVALPDGVVARMQISPYRLQLAGIRTAAVSYRPLAREIEIAGVVSAVAPRRLVEAELSSMDAAELSEGLGVQISADELAGLPAAKGRVRTLPTGSREPWRTAVVEIDDHRRLSAAASECRFVCEPARRSHCANRFAPSPATRRPPGRTIPR